MKNAWNPMEEKNKAGQEKERLCKGLARSYTEAGLRCFWSSHSFGLD